MFYLCENCGLHVSGPYTRVADNGEIVCYQCVDYVNEQLEMSCFNEKVEKSHV